MNPNDLLLPEKQIEEILASNYVFATPRIIADTASLHTAKAIRDRLNYGHLNIKKVKGELDNFIKEMEGHNDKGNG